jgi:4-hydroxy-3-polyprenylbenzoate decarboxylase
MILGITGASGIVYAQRFIDFLPNDVQLHLVISNGAKKVIAEEVGQDLMIRNPRVEVYPNADLGAAIASGSFKVEAMVILPCSMTTLAAVAMGLGDNLIRRAADVMLKERRKLVIVPREAPFSSIHLENMLKLSREGVSVIPANPGFYHQPQTMDDLINFVVQKVYDQLNIEVDLITRWQGSTSPKIKKSEKVPLSRPFLHWLQFPSKN